MDVAVHKFLSLPFPSIPWSSSTPRWLKTYNLFKRSIYFEVARSMQAHLDLGSGWLRWGPGSGGFSCGWPVMLLSCCWAGGRRDLGLREKEKAGSFSHHSTPTSPSSNRGHWSRVQVIPEASCLLPSTGGAGGQTHSTGLGQAVQCVQRTPRKRPPG